MNEKMKSDQKELAFRKKYIAPRLSQFGSVGSLTQGGSDPGMEMAGMMLNEKT